MHVIDILFETVHTNISAHDLEGLKDVVARRIKSLPDDDVTAKALKEIEDLLSHVVHGGRSASIGKEIDAVQDRAVHDAKKVLARLILSIIDETGATPEHRGDFFNAWKADKIVDIGTLLSHEKVDFATVFYGYGTNPIITEFVNEVMMVSELGMGRGEFGLNVLSKSISVAGKGDKDASGSKKGDLQIKTGGKTYQVELKTELGGAARFGDQEVRPAEGFETAAISLNTFVKKHPMYKHLSRKISNSGMNLNQAIEFNQMLQPADRNTFLGLVRSCVSLIFGGAKGGRDQYVAHLRKNVNQIMQSIESGDSGSAAQQWSQANFNYYMSKKHDDGVLYANLNNKSFIYYTDAEQLLSQGLRFHASTPYISATKDPVRTVYPQISVQATTFGGDAAQQSIKKISKGKNPLSNPDFAEKLLNWTNILATRRGINSQAVKDKILKATAELILQKTPGDQIISQLELKIPQLVPKKATPKPPAATPLQTPASSPTEFQQALAEVDSFFLQQPF
jgi:hypothetical protein